MEIPLWPLNEGKHCCLGKKIGLYLRIVVILSSLVVRNPRNNIVEGNPVRLRTPQIHPLFQPSLMWQRNRRWGNCAKSNFRQTDIVLNYRKPGPNTNAQSYDCAKNKFSTTNRGLSTMSFGAGSLFFQSSDVCQSDAKRIPLLVVDNFSNQKTSFSFERTNINIPSGDHKENLKNPLMIGNVNNFIWIKCN